MQLRLLDLLNFAHFRIALLAMITAFIISMLVMPPLIKLIRKFQLFDHPDERKEHQVPIPTMGGLASCTGMITACLLWYPFSNDAYVISMFLSIAVLLSIGVMDDLRNISARYKFGIQIAVGLLISGSGVRIEGLNGLLGIYELPVLAQYTITTIAIAGITNAFNLIDGIDGLAGGIGFMSLMTLGIFLVLSGDYNNGIIAFSLGGGMLGFLYFNFNPARIFMGDTGSLVLGFIISVLCIRLIQLNTLVANPVVPNVPVFVLSIVAIPVFDTLRVFGIRTWMGRSPFSPDKNHIHHLLTNNGWSHRFTTKLICFIHAVFLSLGYLLKGFHQTAGMLVLLVLMTVTILVFRKMKVLVPSTSLLPVTD